ncbi:hypothetical protein QEH56_24050, partial [Pelagicoccus enzymogenes]|nr:hypothetical protein [Pelagicoccus enzymogenes]
SIEGYRCAEIVVTHHARQHGVSKYGVKRFARGFFDMLTVHFLKNYKDRPLHLFGGLAAVALAVGIGAFTLSAWLAFQQVEGALSLVAGSAALIAACPILLALGFTNELRISGKGGEAESPVGEVVDAAQPRNRAHKRSTHRSETYVGYHR